jgi:methylamine dehydrogenase accessory protein MauD
MSPLWIASYIVLWVIVAALTVVVTGLLRQLGLIHLRMGADPGVLMTPEGLNRGVEAPDFEILDVRTQHPVRLSTHRGRRVLLVFLETGCSACRDLVPHLNEIARVYRDEVDRLVVCYGHGATCAEYARQADLRPTLLADPTNSIATRYEVRINPFASLIDAEGTVLIRGVVNTWPQLEALLAEEGTFQKAQWTRLTMSDDAAAPVRDGSKVEEAMDAAEGLVGSAARHGSP